MNVTAQKFQSSYALVCKSSARSNHRTTLPQSALTGCQLPQRGSREWLVPFIGVLAEILRYGRFSSPLRNSKDLTLYHSSRYTPSVSPCGLPAPSEREPGMAMPFTRPPGNRNVAGDFHRPYGGDRPGGGNQSSSSFRTAMKASEGTETVPKVRIRFLPSFCFSSSFFFRVMSPP